MTAPVWAGKICKAMLLDVRRKIALSFNLLISLQGVGSIPANAAETYVVMS